MFHAPFIEQSPYFHLKSILERTKSKSKKEYPLSNRVRDFEELLSDSSIELIIINTPTYLHYEMTKKSLMAGKHVVVEKPFTVTVQEGEELILLARRLNKILTVYHNKRLESDFLTVKKVIDKSLLGNLELFKNTIHRNKPLIGDKVWKEDSHYPGAGLLYDFGSHMIDQCLLLFGWPKDLISKLVMERINSQVVDGFELTLVYNDFKAIVSADMMSESVEPTYVLEGKDGLFVKYGFDSQEKRIEKGARGSELLEIGNEPIENSGELKFSNKTQGSFISTEKGIYFQFYENLYQVIRHKAKPIVLAEDALQVIKLIEWAERLSPIR